MTNQKFDDIFKSKLSEHDNAPQSPDWDQFSQILKKSDGFEDLDFDKEVSEKVKNHQIPYSENHWHLLKERLVREQAIRTKLYLAKLTEITAVVLLLFGALSYAGLKLDNKLEADPKMFAHLYDQKAETSSINQSVLNSETLSQISAGAEAYRNKNQAASENINYAQESTIQIPVLSNNTPLVVSKLAESNVKSLQLKMPLLNPGISTSNLDSKTEMLAAATPDINTLPIYKPELFASTITKAELKSFVGSGVSIIRSPYDEVYQNEAATLISRIDRAGIGYAIGTDKLKMTVGLEYSKMNYQPIQVIETYGSLRDGLKQTSLKSMAFQTARIPLGVKHDFLNKKDKRKISPYLSVNVGINGILTSDYDVEENVLPSDFRPVDTNTKRSNNNSKLSTKEFTKGVLQGGDFVSNLFLDANMEAGIELKLFQNTRLNTGLSYSTFLASKGLGPNGDRHDNLTLNVGLTFSLN